MDVGKRVRELREQKGISTNKLANLSGISQSYLRDIELGDKNPTVEVISYICGALNITLQDFFTEQNVEKISPFLSLSLILISPCAKSINGSLWRNLIKFFDIFCRNSDLYNLFSLFSERSFFHCMRSSWVFLLMIFRILFNPL